MAETESELARRLVHDVGKYIARTARNLRGTPVVSESIRLMLIKDLFETYAGRRASEILVEACGVLSPASLLRLELERCWALLAILDDHEAAIRSGDAESLRLAIDTACEVSDRLTALAGISR